MTPGPRPALAADDGLVEALELTAGLTRGG